VVGRQITPELEVFRLLEISKPADLHQIGYHALRILPRPTEGKRRPIGSALRTRRGGVSTDTTGSDRWQIFSRQ
jgi:hypothetical protein